MLHSVADRGCLQLPTSLPLSRSLSPLSSPSSNCMSNQCSPVQPSTKTFLPHSAPGPRFLDLVPSTPPLLLAPIRSMFPPLPLCFCAHTFSLSVALPPLHPCLRPHLLFPGTGSLSLCCLSTSLCSVPSPEMNTRAALFPSMSAGTRVYLSFFPLMFLNKSYCVSLNEPLRLETNKMQLACSHR